MKKWLVMIVVAVMMLGLFAGCSQPAADAPAADAPAADAPVADAPAANEPAADEPAADEPAADAPATDEGGLLIGVSIPDMSNPMYDILVEGMESALQDDDELLVVDAGLDIAKQMTTIEDFINGGCDAICLAAFEPDGIVASMELCNEKGIPLFVFDNASSRPDLAVTTIVSDNYALGYEGGKILVDAMPEGGKVGMYEYNVASICVQRADGFKAALEELGGGKFEIVNEQEGDPTVDAAMPITENMLQATPDLDAIWAVNNAAALGVHAAVESAQKLDQITIVAVDDHEDIITKIKEGTMLCTVAQDFPGIGRMTIEAVYANIAGEELEEEVLVPVTPITIDTIE